MVYLGLLITRNFNGLRESHLGHLSIFPISNLCLNVNLMAQSNSPLTALGNLLNLIGKPICLRSLLSCDEI